MISFMHYGSNAMASYRYRVSMPASWLGAAINDPRADVHIYAKPIEADLEHVRKAKEQGKTVIADICDCHFDRPWYRKIVKMADLVTTSSQWTADYISNDFSVNTFFIPESYEFDEVDPHCNGNKLLWFGSSMNYDSLERVRHSINDLPLKVVSDVQGAIPWSLENLKTAFADSDIVILPETAPYKSANRAVEAIRQGCFVVAEPHPSLEGFPIYIGNIRKGIEWAIQNPEQAREMTLEAQRFIQKSLSPKILENAWKTAIRMAQSNCTSGRVVCTGTDGLMSISTNAPTFSAT